MVGRWVEVTIRYVREPHELGDPTVVLVGPCERGDVPLLPVVVSPADAAVLGQGRLPTGHSLDLVRRISAALGAQVTAAYLIPDGARRMSGSLDLRTPTGRVQVEVEAGQALIAAAGLDLPLLAELRQFTTRRTD